MKKFLKTLLLSVTVAVLSLGLNISALPVPAAEAAVSSWHRGASIQSRYAEDFASDAFKESVRNLRATGANSVALIIPWYQPNAWTSEISPAFNAPSDATLGAAIDYIHSQGMAVMVKPHLDPGDGQWRAGIIAADRASWFRNYSAMLNRLGEVAEEHGAEMMSVGAELIHMATYTSNADNTQQWVNMINSLRSVYSGKLTYSANWGNDDFATEVPHIGFWPNLDYIGISGYYPISFDSQSDRSWNSWDTSRIKPLADQYGKQVIFTEIGYKSTYGSGSEPYAWWREAGYDGQGQADLYNHLFSYWDSKPYLAGLMLWDWNSNPNYGGQGNTDYTPQHKPAQDVMKTWFGGAQGTTTPPATTTPTAPTGSISATATVSGTTVNAPSAVTVNFQTTGSASNVITNIEVFNPSGTRVKQEYFGGQNLGTQAKQYTVSFTPSVAGTYTVKAGVFNSTWSTAYYWNDGLAQFTVTQEQTNPNPQPGTTTPQTPSASTGDISASATVNASAVGSPASVSVTLDTTGSATNVISDIEIYDQSGARVSQEIWDNESLSAGQPRQYTYSWTPASAGAHTLKVGVFSSDWTTNYFWGDSVLQFTPGSTPPVSTTTNPNPQPGGEPTGQLSATATVTAPGVGQPANVSVTVSSTGSASNVITDIEIYDQNGNRSLQQYYGGENITSGSPKQHDFSWTPQSAGMHTLKVGVFSSDWTKNYLWNDSVLQFAPGSGTTNPDPEPDPEPEPGPEPTEPTGDYTTNIWWPGEGVTVSGLQPLKAMLEGLDVSRYKMYWQVDGDALNEMYDSNEDYPHKESWVDFTGWNWKGDGLYNINFVSKNHSGSTISSRSVNIHITQ